METEHVKVEILRETEKAFYLRDLNSDEHDVADEAASAWFPKSQIHFASRNTKTKTGVAVIPLWILKEKGWNA